MSQATLTRYQVSYQRRERYSNQIIKGSVIYSAAYQGLAIDWTAAELTADEDTLSFVILAIEEI